MEDLRSVVLLRVCAQGPIESNTEFIMIQDLARYLTGLLRVVAIRLSCRWPYGCPLVHCIYEVNLHQINEV